MDIKTLRFDPEQHYAIVSHWWEQHKWPIMPLDFLPKIGVITYSPAGVPLAATWLYQTDSAFCWLEMAVCNPEAEREWRSKGIDEAIKAIASIAKGLGFKAVFTTVRSARYIKRLEENGFERTDQGMTNLVKNL